VPGEYVATALRAGHEPARWKSVVTTVGLIAVPGLLGILVSNIGAVHPANTHGVISVDAGVRKGPGAGYGVAATVSAGTRVTISCIAGSPADKWDRLASPYSGSYIKATSIMSPRPRNC
jgi:hypothetical protein